MANYKTIKDETSATIYEKKSEFISYVTHIKTETEAQAFLTKIRKKHYDANHNCFAYVLKEEQIERQSDDGEPSKTAGMPILEVIKHSQLSDVIIVVTRYFGGTLLGTGGLVRAYTQAAKAGIEASEILEYSLCIDLAITVDYPLYDKICVLAQNNNAKLIKSDFTDKVDMAFRIISGSQQAFVNELLVITKGQEPQISDEFLDIF